jgi:hypothetical protein
LADIQGHGRLGMYYLCIVNQKPTLGTQSFTEFSATLRPKERKAIVQAVFSVSSVFSFYSLIINSQFQFLIQELWQET